MFSKLENFDTLWDVLNLRSGGLAIYGAIIGGGIAVYCVCKYKKVPFLVLADCCTPGIILAQSIGRWGNFMNGEAFGDETSLFCRMELQNSLTSQIITYVHPTFLYESLWNFIGVILINLYYKHRRYDGEIFLLVFGWYGLGRMFIEGLRQDSLYTTLFSVTFRTSQVLAAVIFVICLATLIYLRAKKFTKPLFVYEEKKETTKKSK